MKDKKIEGYWFSKYETQYPMPEPNVLTEKETARIPYFKFKEAKDTYIASQGALRMLISGYLGISPDLVKTFIPCETLNLEKNESQEMVYCSTAYDYVQVTTHADKKKSCAFVKA